MNTERLIEMYEKELFALLEYISKRFIVDFDTRINIADIPFSREIVDIAVQLGFLERLDEVTYKISRPSRLARLLVRLRRFDALFPLIDGYEDIKEFIAKSFLADNVHILLVGPPASGKTLFLESIYIINYDRAVYFDATNTTAIGLVEGIMAKQPRFVAIDEIDKPYDPKLYYTLSNILEYGKIIIHKHRIAVEKSVRLNCYASANKTTNIPKNILDRFLKFRLEAYTPEQVKKISLTNIIKLGIIKDPGLAEELVSRLVDDVGMTSIRDIIKLAKLVKSSQDIEFVIQITRKYRLHKKLQI